MSSDALKEWKLELDIAIRDLREAEASELNAVHRKMKAQKELDRVIARVATVSPKRGDSR